MIGGIFCTIFAAAAHADFKDDIGYTRLQSELGASTPDGAGVIVAQNEAGYANPTEYPLEFPDLDFQYPVLDILPPDETVFAEHTTIDTRYFVGNQSSIAPGVPTLIGYEADKWAAAQAHVNNILNLQGMNSTISGGPLPASSAARVTSHGIGYSSTSAFLRRVDWLIDTDETLQIAAHTLGGLPMAYNTISVGISAGTNGLANVFYGPWKDAAENVYNQNQHLGPTLVADSTPLPDPSSSMSSVTPVAASVAVLLVQKGHDDASLSTDPAVQSFTNRAGLLIRNAERSEVIKAIMMAGANRNGRYTADDGTLQYLPTYRAPSQWQDTNGLDKRVGAGQVNIRNSYYIIAAGEQNSTEDGGGQGNVPGSGQSQRGFDYDPHFGGLNSTNNEATYVLPASATPRLLTASLVWNITVVGDTQGNPGVFDGTTSLNDLKLSVIDTTVFPIVVASSDSTIENTENIWFELQANHAYELLVERGNGSPAFDWDYGLAWQAVPDTDADGVPDEQDNCALVANNDPGTVPHTTAIFKAQLDADGDGYGNMCDTDINQSGGTTVGDYTLLRNVLSHFDDETAATCSGTCVPGNIIKADLNGSGQVTTADYTILRNRLNTAPGPSGLCVATPVMPCTSP